MSLIPYCLVKAHKECLEDGTWFRHPKSNATWSNYTTCVDQEAFSVSSTFYFNFLIFMTSFRIQKILPWFSNSILESAL